MGRVYIYVVDRDFGFAPNPFNGFCSLATCKPGIRNTASMGDWIIGMGGRRLNAVGRCVYAMRVSSKITFNEYWTNPKYLDKKPVRNGSRKMMVGDNIYFIDVATQKWQQADSHHSKADGSMNEHNLAVDTKSDKVLISDHFIYFGIEAPVVPQPMLDAIGYARSLSVACLDPTFGLHLPAPAFDLSNPGQDTELTINAAIEMGIEAFLKENAPPTDDMSQTITRPDGTTTYVEDVRAKSRQRRIAVFQSQEPVFRACLNIIVNAACFISFQPEDITDEWEGEPPTWAIEALNNPSQARRDRDRKKSAIRTVAAGDYTRIKICGENLFSDAHQDGGPGHGISPRAHWRRGHWRRQRHGVGLSLTTPRWIRPTIVKRDNGPLVETRIYDVQKQS